MKYYRIDRTGVDTEKALVKAFDVLDASRLDKDALIAYYYFLSHDSVTRINHIKHISIDTVIRRLIEVQLITLDDITIRLI